MDLLAFKVLASPLLLLAASLAARRWGDTVGGLWVGLPLTSGPISLFLSLEHGANFAADATHGSLEATVAQAAFALAYSIRATRGVVAALSAACAAFAISASLLQWSAFGQTELFGVAVVSMWLALRFIPRDDTGAVSTDTPCWNLPARMIVIAALVITVTKVAPLLGPTVSGTLASFPFMGVILAIFAHRSPGGPAARRVMRGMVAGLLSFATFFYVVCLLLVKASIPWPTSAPSPPRFSCRRLLIVG